MRPSRSRETDSASDSRFLPVRLSGEGEVVVAEIRFVAEFEEVPFGRLEGAVAIVVRQLEFGGVKFVFADDGIEFGDPGHAWP